MSIEEQQEVKKAMRTENLIRDAIKGSFFSLAIYILWNDHTEQTKRTLQKVDVLEAQIKDCNSEKQRRFEESILRIENFVISKN